MASRVEEAKLVRIGNTEFLVDGFQFQREDVIHYVLTHFHSDHTIGLSRHFDKGTIYCSEVTAALIIEIMKVDSKRVIGIPLTERREVVPGVELTLLDANHCPGSAIAVFEELQTESNASEEGSLIIHTGDCRAASSMREGLLHWLSGRRVKELFLDTTYCAKRWCFPAQEIACSWLAELTQVELQREPKTLFIVGCYQIGKERAVRAVADAAASPVFLEQRRWDILRLTSWADAKLSNGATMWSIDKEGCNVWMTALGGLGHDVLKHFLDGTKGQFEAVVAFRPTGWAWSPKAMAKGALGCRPWIENEGRTRVYSVPYSEHSSYDELQAFASAIRPQRLIPTVNSETRSARERMLSHFLHLVDLKNDRERMDHYFSNSFSSSSSSGSFVDILSMSASTVRSNLLPEDDTGDDTDADICALHRNHQQTCHMKLQQKQADCMQYTIERCHHHHNKNNTSDHALQQHNHQFTTTLSSEQVFHCERSSTRKDQEDHSKPDILVPSRRWCRGALNRQPLLAITVIDDEEPSTSNSQRHYKSGLLPISVAHDENMFPSTNPSAAGNSLRIKEEDGSFPDASSSNSRSSYVELLDSDDEKPTKADGSRSGKSTEKKQAEEDLRCVDLEQQRRLMRFFEATTAKQRATSAVKAKPFFRGSKKAKKDEAVKALAAKNALLQRLGAASETKEPSKKKSQRKAQTKARSKNAPAASARKRKSPPSTNETTSEKRAGRFIPKPSARVQERIDRAFSHRLYFLSRKTLEPSQNEAQSSTAVIDHGERLDVLGSTGNVYNVDLKKDGNSCTCLDFAKSTGVCKHLLFVMLRVLKLPREDSRVWQTGLTTSELQPLLARLRSDEFRRGADLADIKADATVMRGYEAALGSQTSVARQLLPADCPICFEEMLEVQPESNACSLVDFCRVCGHNIHVDCRRRWATSGRLGDSCPMCRSPWQKDDTKAGGCLNLAEYSAEHRDVSLVALYPETHRWIQRRDSVD